MVVSKTGSGNVLSAGHGGWWPPEVKLKIMAEKQEVLVLNSNLRPEGACILRAVNLNPACDIDMYHKELQIHNE